MTPAPAAASGLAAWIRRPMVMLGLALVALAVLMSALGKLAGPSEAVLKPLTKGPGMNLYAAFSPDGKQLAYSVRGQGRDDTFDIFVQPVAGGAARQVTSGSAIDVAPVWSPDGASLAFERVEEGRARIVVVPSAGGEARTITEFAAPAGAQLTPAVAWMRDGQTLIVSVREGEKPAALMRVAATGGASQAFTAPPESGDGDGTPAVSPDGASVAFVRRTRDEAGDIWVCDRDGKSARRITYDNHALRGLAWTPNGGEIVFASNRGPGWQLWRVPAAGGTAREILATGSHAQYPAISPSGQKLVFSESPALASIWRTAVADVSESRPLITPSGRTSAPSYSPGGKQIAYRMVQPAGDELWVMDNDGGGARRVALMTGRWVGRPNWSPDGTRLVFESFTQPQQPEVWLVAAAGGTPKRVAQDAGGTPAWSRSGEWIYFGVRQVWRVRPDGSGRQQLTERGGSNGVESPDGKWVYYQRGREIRRMPPGGGEGESVMMPEANLYWGSLKPDNNGVYFLAWNFRTRAAEISYYSLEERKTNTVLSLARADFDRGSVFDVSPDGRTIVYSKLNQSEASLKMVEGFR